MVPLFVLFARTELIVAEPPVSTAREAVVAEPSETLEAAEIVPLPAKAPEIAT